MDWSDIKDRVMQAMGAVSGELDTEVENFCKDALADIHGEGWWPWNRRSVSITAKKLQSGACTYSQGATTITVATTGLVADQDEADLYAGGLIQLEGGNTYTVVSYTFSTKVVVVDSTIVDADAAADSGAYELAQDQLELPVAVESVVAVHDVLQDFTLRAVPTIRRRRLWPDPFRVTGTRPDEWWVGGVNSSGNLVLSLYPFPDADRNYVVDYWKKLAVPSADGDELEDITGIPTRFHPVIVARGKEKAFEFEDESEIKRAHAAAEYLRGVKKMKSFAKLNAGAMRQLHSDRVSRRWIDPDAHVEITGV